MQPEASGVTSPSTMEDNHSQKNWDIVQCVCGRVCMCLHSGLSLCVCTPLYFPVSSLKKMEAIMFGGEHTLQREGREWEPQSRVKLPFDDIEMSFYQRGKDCSWIWCYYEIGLPHVNDCSYKNALERRNVQIEPRSSPNTWLLPLMAPAHLIGLPIINGENSPPLPYISFSTSDTFFLKQAERWKKLWTAEGGGESERAGATDMKEETKWRWKMTI